ncbi:MAG: FAD-dependent oxidoreductase [Pseudomonadota bacterium]|nr:FAD-dependent oxidoreductase [Pseudomonadota bacterium]
MERIAIIGAGLAGLTAAQGLRAAGRATVVFEKSRGLGGRLATRRTEFGPIDHGAPGVPESVPVAGEVWSRAEPGMRQTGLPGMSALARHVSDGLEVQTQIEVQPLVRTESGWALRDQTGTSLGVFDRVIVTAPPVQAAALTAADDALAKEIAAAEMSPLWTLLLAFADPTGLEQEVKPLQGALATAIPMLAKPGQTGFERWTVHAGEAWSAANLELEKEDAARALFDAFREQADVPAGPDYLAAHRWRYARVRTPLGKPFVATADASLIAGGDWALGALASHAVESGRAMAAHVVESAG